MSEFSNKLLSNVIKIAFDKARHVALESIQSNGSPNQKRAVAWINSLADGFKVAYAGIEGVEVFSKHDYSHQSNFGLNELLFDINVCKTKSVRSASGKHELKYVHDALWAVESEFEGNDSKALLVDFNKLVLSSAANKLFVGPYRKPSENIQFLNVLLKPAQRCSGRVFAAFIPVPEEWPKILSDDKPQIVVHTLGWTVAEEEIVTE